MQAFPRRLLLRIFAHLHSSRQGIVPWIHCQGEQEPNTPKIRCRHRPEELKRHLLPGLSERWVIVQVFGTPSTNPLVRLTLELKCWHGLCHSPGWGWEYWIAGAARFCPKGSLCLFWKLLCARKWKVWNFARHSRLTALHFLCHCVRKGCHIGLTIRTKQGNWRKTPEPALDFLLVAPLWEWSSLVGWDMMKRHAPVQFQREHSKQRWLVAECHLCSGSLNRKIWNLAMWFLERNPFYRARNLPEVIWKFEWNVFSRVQ